MKILLLAEVSAEKVIGGAERVLRHQAIGLAALGLHVELLTRAPEHATVDIVEMDGIRKWRYAVNRKHEAAFVWSSVRRSVEAFDRIRATEPFDMVIIHQAMAGLGPILARRHVASRWIYVCHSLAHEEYDTRHASPRSSIATLRRQANLQARRSVERAVNVPLLPYRGPQSIHAPPPPSGKQAQPRTAASWRWRGGGMVRSRQPGL